MLQHGLRSLALTCKIIPSIARPVTCLRSMNSVPPPSTSHEERTATQPRESSIETVRLGCITHVGPDDQIRQFRLYLQDLQQVIKFLPGQWLDVLLPGITKAGGFTITSTPKETLPCKGKPGYIELAVQRTSNPPSQWLFQPVNEILNSRIKIRVGGSFHWPPLGLDEGRIKRLLLIGGGMGVNPLMSIFTHLMQPDIHRPEQIAFLYGTKAAAGGQAGPRIEPSQILFCSRLQRLMAEKTHSSVELKLFLTCTTDKDVAYSPDLPRGTVAGRINQDDLDVALGDMEDREETVCYVCGPPAMTDSFVEYLVSREGMDRERVLCEKWW